MRAAPPTPKKTSAADALAPEPLVEFALTPLDARAGMLAHDVNTVLSLPASHVGLFLALKLVADPAMQALLAGNNHCYELMNPSGGICGVERIRANAHFLATRAEWEPTLHTCAEGDTFFFPFGTRAPGAARFSLLVAAGCVPPVFMAALLAAVGLMSFAGAAAGTHHTILAGLPNNGAGARAVHIWREALARSYVRSFGAEIERAVPGFYAAPDRATPAAQTLADFFEYNETVAPSPTVADKYAATVYKRPWKRLLKTRV
jgi:hypothetical protein